MRKSDPAISRPLQARYFLSVTVVMSFLVPLGLGFLLGDPWGRLVLAGFLRLVLVLQATFAINSVTHSIGAQPYSRRNSSPDSFLAALVTMGEGYHNYHHTFPGDYRNGVRRYQFDPTKWILRALVPLPPLRGIYRARMQVHAERLEDQLRVAASGPEARAERRRFDDWVDRWNRLRADVAHWSSEVDVPAKRHLRLLRPELRRVSRELRASYNAWKGLVDVSSPRPVPAA